MRIIIAGSRTVSEDQVREALEYCDWKGFISCVVSGGAKGADRVGEKWAKENGLEIKLFPAEWEKFGKRAGPLRNQSMAEYANGLISVWDGESRGTANMIELARDLGLRVSVFRPDIKRIDAYQATGKYRAQWEDAEERAAMMEFSGGLSRPLAERAAGRLVASSMITPANKSPVTE